jgi:hypothetical protein
MPLALITMNYFPCTFQIDVVDLSETYGYDRHFKKAFHFYIKPKISYKSIKYSQFRRRTDRLTRLPHYAFIIHTSRATHTELSIYIKKKLTEGKCLKWSNVMCLLKARFSV